MSLISTRFFLFLLGTVIFYYVVPKRAQWMLLLLASGVFYLFSGLANVLFLLFSVSTFYGCARWTKRLLKDGSPEKKNLAKRLLALVIIVNFGVLALFKLEKEATAWLQPLALRLGLATDTGGLLLPLGISFYMFQGTGYLLDVYRGKITPQKNYAKFALFISFFPQVVQGPISRFDWLSDQLTSQREFDYGRVRRAAQLILYGCFKKLVIADNIAPFTGSVFSGAAEQPGAMVALACVLGTLQLYCDFSGGIDVASGVAEMFGVALPENFRQPYFARSLAEYWRRWHITLNEWWREYLFFPITLSRPMNRLSRFLRKHVGGGAGKIISVYVGILVVRVANSCWHGLNFNHLMSGAYFSVLMIAALALRDPLYMLTKRMRIPTESFGWRLFQMGRTFLILCLNRVFFMTKDISSAFGALGNLFGGIRLIDLRNGALYANSLTHLAIGVIAAGICVVFTVDILHERGVKIRDRLEKSPAALSWMLMLAAIFAALVFGGYGAAYNAQDFIYTRF